MLKIVIPELSGHCFTVQCRTISKHKYIRNTLLWFRICGHLEWLQRRLKATGSCVFNCTINQPLNMLGAKFLLVTLKNLRLESIYMAFQKLSFLGVKMPAYGGNEKKSLPAKCGHNLALSSSGLQVSVWVRTSWFVVLWSLTGSKAEGLKDQGQPIYLLWSNRERDIVDWAQTHTRTAGHKEHTHTPTYSAHLAMTFKPN